MKIDLAKRRRVMERSMRLGHCICDPRRPCPCDVFREQQICPCAGERPDPVNVAQVKLTQLVHNAGCASKISPADLEGVLRRLPEVKDPAVISGLAAADDAAIYRIADNLCLVQTVDVFTPCVDDPHLFGRICAANCLSDIYAMGGEPRTALSVLAFPSETLPGEIMYQMLAGAMETLGQAGVALVGGHSIKDEEIKLGFAITGVIDPAVAAALERPQAGDVLVLTKPLGTGVLAFCAQVGRGNAAGMAAAAESMAMLNKPAAEAMKGAGASACTDITGFGLFGHLLRMARQSRLTVQVFAEALPAFEGVLEAFRDGVIPGAVERNREFVSDHLEVAPEVEEAWVHLGCDAQTSGGLLIAIAPGRLEQLQRGLAERGIQGVVIGRCVGASNGRILLTRQESVQVGTSSAASPNNHGSHGFHGSHGCSEEKEIRDEVELVPTGADVNEQLAKDKTMNSDLPEAAASPASVSPGAPAPSPAAESHPAGCCADVFESSSPASTAAESNRAFGAMMRATLSAGALSAKTKELILFSLILHSRCAPCFEAHYEKAIDMGITQAELDEAAWCAIAMGGAPVRMFYQESLQKVQGKGKSGI